MHVLNYAKFARFFRACSFIATDAKACRFMYTSKDILNCFFYKFMRTLNRYDKTISLIKKNVQDYEIEKYRFFIGRKLFIFLIRL